MKTKKYEIIIRKNNDVRVTATISSTSDDPNYVIMRGLEKFASSMGDVFNFLKIDFDNIIKQFYDTTIEVHSYNDYIDTLTPNELEPLHKDNIICYHETSYNPMNCTHYRKYKINIQQNQYLTPITFLVKKLNDNG